jgi:hypothetical protein
LYCSVPVHCQWCEMVARLRHKKRQQDWDFGVNLDKCMVEGSCSLMLLLTNYN